MSDLLTDPFVSSDPDEPLLVAPRPMIIADDAHVTYRVHAAGRRVGRESLLSASAIRGGRELREVPALRGITFTASEGETIGVVGHNGSGKSTLFRAMSGLIPTSQGTILARERPVLLGVNAALVPELSGENNIKLGLLAMGYTPEEAAASVDEIADFAELNEFIYHPMRTYSSGMGARLRFAIASARAHSILLIDEALAVGDRRFKVKSEQRIRELRDSAGLVMIVSHSVGSLRDTCDRVLWVHKGELVADGPAESVIDDYVRWTKHPGSIAVGAASASTASSKARSAEAAGPRVAADTSPRESERTLERRHRFRRTERQRARRRLVAILVAGAAILLAAGAGAAIALLNSAPAPEPSASEAALPGPVIGSFTTAAASAVCADTTGETLVPLNWSVADASRIAIASAPSEVDALETPLNEDLSATAAGFVVPFPCAEESRVYTLTAESPQGGRSSSIVIVSRTMANAPTPSSTPTSGPVTETDTDSGSNNSGGNRNQGSTTLPGGSTNTGGSVDPAPVDPAPVDPAPVDPAPVDPAPVDPAPEQPPTEPTTPPVESVPDPGAVTDG